MIVAALLLSCCLIDSDTILLGDILSLPGTDPRASVSLGYAPHPGLARRILKQDIAAKIVAAGYSVSDLQLPNSVLVRRQTAELGRDQVMQAVLDAFRRQYPEANIAIINIEVPAIPVGTGPLELTASLPGSFDPSTSVFMRLEVRGSGFAKTAFVRTDVRIEVQQPVVKNRIAAHAPIQAGDIEWEPRLLEGEYVTQFEGLVSKKDLQPGQILTSRLLYAPLYVRKGESVTVKAIAGSITIAATMRAKASGRLGETVPLEHISGQGSTTARVIGPRLLETIQ